MAHHSVSHLISGFLRILALISMITPLAVVTAPGQVVPDFDSDPSIDSEIKLFEETGEGAYGVYSISMSTQLGSTTLTLEKDGDKTQVTMPYEDCYALWQYLRERDIGNMDDAPLENPLPDQSTFIFTFQNGSESHTFSAYGVDFLTDTRYREIARAIMEAAGKYSP